MCVLIIMNPGTQIARIRCTSDAGVNLGARVINLVLFGDHDQRDGHDEERARWTPIKQREHTRREEAQLILFAINNHKHTVANIDYFPLRYVSAASSFTNSSLDFCKRRRDQAARWQTFFTLPKSVDGERTAPSW